MTSSPLLHFVLQHLDETKIQYDSTLQFVQFLTTDLYLDLDCRALDGNGEKAGQAQQQKAFKLLCSACAKGNTSVANCLLSAGVDPNQYDNQSLTPLSHASMAGHRDIMHVLFKWGALVNLVCGTRCQTALMSAVETNQLDSTILLCDIGADPNIANTDGVTPLIIASELGNLQIVEVLLQKSADPNHCDSHGWNSLSKACDKSHIEVAFMLTQAGCDLIPNNSRIPLQIAIEKKLVSFVSYMISRNKKAYDYVSSKLSLTEACTDEYLILIENASEEQVKETVKSAWKNKQLNIIQQLYSINPHCQDEMLSREGVNIKDLELEKSQELLSCLSNKNPIFMDLINSGYNPNIRYDGKTLLQICLLEKWHKAVISIVRSSKLNINAVDDIGRTALYYTRFCPILETESGKEFTFDILREHGADVSVRDSFGRNLWHDWVYWDYNLKTPSHVKPIYRDYLTNKVSVHWKDDKGLTALHLAMIANDNFSTQNLIERGSRIDSKDVNGLTPNFHQLSHQSLESKKQTNMYLKEVQEPRLASHVHKLWCESRNNKDKRTKQLMEDILVFREEKFLQEFHEHKEEIRRFWSVMAGIVKEKYPLYSFQMVLSGSCAEGTKVHEMDEVDVLLIMTHPLWQGFTVSPYEAENYTYVTLTDQSGNKSQKYKEIQEVFDGNRLSARAFLIKFYGIIRKCLSEVLRSFPRIHILDVAHILSQGYSINDLHLVWSGKWEGLIFQRFSMDVVPQIFLESSQIPTILKNKDLLKDVYVVPKWNIALYDHEVEQHVFRLGFSHTELDMFQAMSSELRHAYALCKVILLHIVVIDDKPIGKFISSYLLKTKTFELFLDNEGMHQVKRDLDIVRSHVLSDSSENVEINEQNQHLIYRGNPLHSDEMKNPDQVLQYCLQILDKIDSDFKARNLENFFLPSNLIADNQYHDYRARLYVLVCKAMLSSHEDQKTLWNQITELIAEFLCRPGRNELGDLLERDFYFLDEMGETKNRNLGYLAHDTVRNIITNHEVTSDSIRKVQHMLQTADEARDNDDEDDEADETDEKADIDDTENTDNENMNMTQACGIQTDSHNKPPIKKQIRETRNKVLTKMAALIDAGKVDEKSVSKELTDVVLKSIKPDKTQILTEWTDLTHKTAKQIITPQLINKTDFKNEISTILTVTEPPRSETNEPVTWREKAWESIADVISDDFPKVKVLEEVQTVVAKTMLPEYYGEWKAWAALADKVAKILLDQINPQEENPQWRKIANDFFRLLDRFVPRDQSAQIVEFSRKTCGILKKTLGERKIEAEKVMYEMEGVISKSLLPHDHKILAEWEKLDKAVTKAVVEKLASTKTNNDDFSKEFSRLTNDYELDQIAMIDAMTQIPDVGKERFEALVKENTAGHSTLNAQVIDKVNTILQSFPGNL